MCQFTVGNPLNAHPMATSLTTVIQILTTPPKNTFRLADRVQSQVCSFQLFNQAAQLP